jgi:hypothetical protein
MIAMTFSSPAIDGHYAEFRHYYIFDAMMPRLPLADFIAARPLSIFSLTPLFSMPPPPLMPRHLPDDADAAITPLIISIFHSFR